MQYKTLIILVLNIILLLTLKFFPKNTLEIIEKLPLC